MIFTGILLSLRLDFKVYKVKIGNVDFGYH